MYLVGLPRFIPHVSLREAIASLGLTSNLKLSFDVGDVTSYPGSGQPWLDLSGNGYDFNRGETSGSGSSDPTYVGTAGQRTSGVYWSFDGDDFFTYDSSNEAWMNRLHQNDALWTACCWVYLGTAGDYNALMGTNFDDTNARGVSWEATTVTAKPRFLVTNGTGGGSGVELNVASTTLTPSATTWQFHSISVDEAAGTVTFGLDGTYDVKSSQFFSVGGSATYTMAIAATAGVSAGSRMLQNGGRMVAFGMWEGGTISQANLTAIRNATKGRFGL